MPEKVKTEAAKSPDSLEVLEADENVPVGKKVKKKKSKKKIGVLVGAVVLVLAIAGIGGAIWHEQPSFCNAICHSPMDAYVEGYYEGDDLARIHMEAEISCLDCHESTLAQQVSEGVAWVTGNFKTKPDMMVDFDNGQCLKCHISEEFQAAKTDFLKINPHSDAHQVLKCTDCHKSHRDQVDYCSTCHSSEGHRMIGWPLEGHTKLLAEAGR